MPNRVIGACIARRDSDSSSDSSSPEPPKKPPTPLFRKGFLNGPEKKSPAPVKKDLSQPKVPNSSNKADSSAQKPSKENVCSEQKQKIVIDFAKNMKMIRSKEAGLEK